MEFILEACERVSSPQHLALPWDDNITTGVSQSHQIDALLAETHPDESEATTSTSTLYYQPSITPFQLPQTNHVSAAQTRSRHKKQKLPWSSQAPIQQKQQHAQKNQIRLKSQTVATSAPKTKVSISFKNIAAGITRDNYIPKQFTHQSHPSRSDIDNEIYMPNARGGISAVKKDGLNPEQMDPHEKNAEEQERLAKRLQLNRKLKQKILEKRPEWAVASTFSIGDVNFDDKSYDDGQNDQLFDRNDLDMPPNQFLHTPISAVSGISEENKYTVTKNNTRTKKDKKTRSKSEKPSYTEDINQVTSPINDISFNSSESEQQARVAQSHIENTSQEKPSDSFLHYSANSSSGLPYGYQMLYLPVQVPMSPNDPFFSPVSDLTSPVAVSSKGGVKRENSELNTQQPTPPSIGPKNSQSLSTHPNTLSTQALSFTSLFHPTLQSQLSNSQLLTQLGFSLSSPSLGNWGGFGGLNVDSVANTSPVIGVFVPSTNVSQQSPKHLPQEQKPHDSSANNFQNHQASNANDSIGNSSKNVTCDTGKKETNQWCPQTFYQLAFMQQKQLQLMAQQHSMAAKINQEQQNASGSGAFNQHPETLLKSASLSFLFPISNASLSVPHQNQGEADLVQKNATKRKEFEEDTKNENSNQETMTGAAVAITKTHSPLFIQLQPEQVTQLQQQQEQFLKDQWNTASFEAAKQIMTPILSFGSPDWIQGAAGATATSTNANTWGFGVIANVPLPTGSPSNEITGAFIPFKGSSNLTLVPDLAEQKTSLLIPIQKQLSGVLLGISSAGIGGDKEKYSLQDRETKFSPKLFGLN
ncbi:hypothetical protein HK100_004376 [Physocladia obscura]|uniref:Uncharacterized protein n=1 Tax=Physocladia obscura TaxID=109957 RepID=A0AAD5XGR1_9FUNG|nr:hypothetical protein HK100_004376 [Physocladia obscura]